MVRASHLWQRHQGHERNDPFWCLACVVFGTIALGKGLRIPGSWAKSQLQITYIHGFVKRGLLGQALRIAHMRSVHAVDLFCLSELVLLFGLLLLFTGGSGLLAAEGNPVLPAAFAGSYATTFLAHLIGYQDIALYGLALVLLLLRRPRVRFLWAIPICSAALLIHENFLLSALPVVLFSFVAEAEETRVKEALFYVGALVLLCVGVTVLIALRPSLSPVSLQQFKRETIATASYPIDARVLDVLGMSMVDNLRMNFEVISQNWWWWAELAVAILVNGPLILLLLVSATRLTHGRRRAVFLISSLAPLLLNCIGWDNVRWVSLCTLSSYLNLGLLARSTEPSFAERALSPYRHASVLVLGVGLASGYGLMDGRSINPYPFFPPAVRPAVIRHDGVLGSVL